MAFLCRLWEGSTDFSLDAERLTSTIVELEAGGEATAGRDRGRRPGARAAAARRPGSSSRPRRSSGRTPSRCPPRRAPRRAPASRAGSPSFSPRRESARATARARARRSRMSARAPSSAFRQLITTLRLFKAGSVGLGPYAWTRAGTNRWRRIATGAGRSRPGRLPPRRGGAGRPCRALTNPRLSLVALRALGPPRTAAGTSRVLARAISRFEAGLERSVVLEALNDYLLGASVPARGRRPRRAQPLDAGLGAVRRAGASRRDQGDRRARPRAGARAVGRRRRRGAATTAPRPAEVTAAIEDLIRAILRDAACGHLGSDLRSTADEILLADGLAVGEGGAEQRGGAEEWDGPRARCRRADRDRAPRRGAGRRSGGALRGGRRGTGSGAGVGRRSGGVDRRARPIGRSRVG